MLKIENLNKSYIEQKKEIEIFKNFNLTVDNGEFVTLFGPNGCGKSTLLQIIAGITPKEKGNITFSNSTNPKIGFVFQDYNTSLFPWMTLKENIAFPLKLRGIKRERREYEATKIFETFHYDLNLDSYPEQASGGQKQFTAILRALIEKPDLLLLDEPFCSLDYESNLTMMEKLHEIWEKTKITTIFISHHIDEAIFLSTRILVLGKKPTGLQKEMKNSLTFPRHREIIGSPEFAHIKKQIIQNNI